MWDRSWRASLLLVCLASNFAVADEKSGAPFQLHTLDLHAFQKVQIWAPPPGSPGRFATFILLHGNQPGAPDPTWMIGLHWQTAFARRILIVPSLVDGGYEFGAPATARAVAALVDDVARRFPVDRNAIYLVGYSAGASRVLSVAKKIPSLKGIATVAGDIARPIRDVATPRDRLQAMPILLVCMADDAGPHTNCRLNEANLALLARRGFPHVALQRLPGTHQLDLAALAPLLDDWAATLK